MKIKLVLKSDSIIDGKNYKAGDALTKEVDALVAADEVEKAIQVGALQVLWLDPPKPEEKKTVETKARK